MNRGEFQAAIAHNQVLLTHVQEIKTDHPLWGYRRILSFLSTAKACRGVVPDYDTEVFYWYGWLPKNWEKISNSETWKRIFPKMLLRYIREAKNDNNNKLKLLEVGSCPVSMLAWGIKKNLFQITAIDPLADIYEGIMKAYNYDYPVKPINGYGEKLLQVVAKNSFDLVYSSNALDHARSPERCVENMVEALKKKGIICLEGFINEGSKHFFSGLHQYNLEPIDGHLFCSDKRKKMKNLTKKLRLKCMYQQVVKTGERANNTPFVRGDNDSEWYTIIFQKI